MSGQAELPTQRMSFDEFVEWCDRVEGKYELIDGYVVHRHPDPNDPTRAQAEQRRHVRLKARIYAAFDAQLRKNGSPCEALSDGLKVETSPGLGFQPDALIDCGNLSDEATTAHEPVVVVEVLSPSTYQRDLGEKLEGYFTVPSIAHYLIVDPERRRIVRHSRGQDVIATSIHAGGAIELDPPGITIDMDALFEGMTPPDASALGTGGRSS